VSQTIYLSVLFPGFTIRHLNFLFDVWYLNQITLVGDCSGLKKNRVWIIDVLRTSNAILVRDETSRSNTRDFPCPGKLKGLDLVMST
jgi:hypothetical protein